MKKQSKKSNNIFALMPNDKKYKKGFRYKKLLNRKWKYNIQTVIPYGIKGCKEVCYGYKENEYL